MLNLVVLLAVAILLSFIVDKDIEDVIPPFLFTVLVGIYAVAILGKSHHALLLSFFGFAGIWIIYIIMKRRILPTVGELKAKFTPLPIGLMVYLLVCIVFVLLYSNRFVIGWDDLNHFATFPKDMFYYGTMPVGVNSCTIFRDYLPLLQLFFYWGFQGIGDFSEPLMFQYKIVLIFTCMLPFFKLLNQNKGIKRICISLIAIVLPYVFLIEILDGLSVDTVMALFFGYTLVAIFNRETCDWFYYYKIISALLVLILIKNPAIMYAIIAVVIWFILEMYDIKNKDKKSRMIVLSTFIGGCLLTGAAYCSWKLFCIRHGNTTYLTDIVSINMDAGIKGLVLPTYGMNTIKNYLLSLVTMSTNLGKTGFTVVSATILTIILCIILKKNQVFNKKDIVCYLVLGGCFIFYLVFMLYTYLFVFEQWEAEGLSSLDRYLGTYILAMFYVIIYRVFKEKVKKEKLVLLVMTGVVLISLNHIRLFNYLVPSRYEDQLKEAAQEKQRVEAELAGIDVMNMEEGSVLIVNAGTDDFYTRYMNYNFIPVISVNFNIEEYSDEELAKQLKEKIVDRNIYYVYFTKKSQTQIKAELLTSMLAEGVALKENMLYYYNSETALIEEKIFNKTK